MLVFEPADQQPITEQFDRLVLSVISQFLLARYLILNHLLNRLTSLSPAELSRPLVSKHLRVSHPRDQVASWLFLVPDQEDLLGCLFPETQNLHLLTALESAKVF